MRDVVANAQPCLLCIMMVGGLVKRVTFAIGLFFQYTSSNNRYVLCAQDVEEYAQYIGVVTFGLMERFPRKNEID